MTDLAPALAERDETPLQRCDRHLAELLQEVRVAQTGVQVLFGFLLTVPFTARFHLLAPGERALYFTTLVVAGLAAMLLIAPSAQHRVLFRCGDKEHLVMRAHRYAIAGLVCVAVAMAGALTLMGTVVVGGPAGALVGAAGGGACAWVWFVQPWRRRLRLLRGTVAYER